MTHPDPEPGHVFLHGRVELAGDETLHDTLDELKKLDLPEFLTSQSVGLGVEDPEQMHVAFSDGEESGVYFKGGSSADELEASFVLTADHRGHLPTLLTRTLEKTGPLEITQAHASFRLKKAFGSLDLPIGDADVYGVVGLRLESENADFIVQQDGKETSIQYILQDPEALEGPIGDEFLEAFDAEVAELIGRIT